MQKPYSTQTQHYPIKPSDGLVSFWLHEITSALFTTSSFGFAKSFATFATNLVLQFISRLTVVFTSAFYVTYFYCSFQCIQSLLPHGFLIPNLHHLLSWKAVSILPPIFCGNRSAGAIVPPIKHLVSWHDTIRIKRPVCHAISVVLVA